MISPAQTPEAKERIVGKIRLYPLREDGEPEPGAAYFMEGLVGQPKPTTGPLRVLQVDDGGYPVTTSIGEEVLFHGSRLSGMRFSGGFSSSYMPEGYALHQMLQENTENGIEHVGSLHVSGKDRTLREVTIGSRTFLLGGPSVERTFDGTTLFEAFEIKEDGTLEHDIRGKLVSTCSIEIGVNGEVLSKVNDVEEQIRRRVESLTQSTN